MPRNLVSVLALGILMLFASACSLGTSQGGGEAAADPTRSLDIAQVATPLAASPSADDDAAVETSVPEPGTAGTVSSAAPTATETTASGPNTAAPTEAPSPTVEATSAPQPNAAEATATVAPTEPAPTSTPEPVVTLYVATEDYVDLNLRAQPSTESEILDAMPYRTAVRATGSPVAADDGQKWYKVEYKGQSGYAAAWLLSEKQPAAKPPGLRGVVSDARTGQPVSWAWVYLGNQIARTDSAGRYVHTLPAGERDLVVMAPGYARFSAQAAKVSNGRVALQPFDAKGVYMPFYQSARPADVERMFDMIERTTLNSIVIDIKSDEGYVWRSNVPMAREIGASKDDMDLQAFTAAAHERGIYVIGRFTVFKDPTLARARPQMAIASTEGGLWDDTGGILYADPFDRRVWQYMGDLAVDMAAQGVDEIQYDYIRFPVDGDLSTARYSAESTGESRIRQITGFTQYMEQRLRPSQVFISADIFGRVVWHPEDPNTGQVLDQFAQYVDYVSPMLYPSGFNEGSGGYDIPTENSYGLLKQSLELSADRLQGTSTKVRPWLQSFPDYAWDVPYGLTQYLEQRRAAEEVGTSGWLYWNAAGEYDERTFVDNP